jgi:hypothetical protein
MLAEGLEASLRYLEEIIAQDIYDEIPGKQRKEDEI